MEVQSSNLSIELIATRIASLNLAISYGKIQGEETFVQVVDEMSAIVLAVKTAYIVEAITGKIQIDSKFKLSQLEFAKETSLNDLIDLRNSLLKKSKS